MKAITYSRYGSPDVLELSELEMPELAEDGVLVRVQAASVNPLDWHRMRGQPIFVRMGEGWRRPKETRLGVDLAGTVEAVGPAVTAMRPGDRVFGVRTGSFGEYVRGSAESALAPMPAGLSFEQAAAIPVAGTTALQALRDRGQLRAGQRVLINGASGGVGSFAVQIAKALGAKVTGVTSAGNVEAIRSLGADHVVDATREDFTRSAQRYDLILDIAGSRPLSACRRVMADDGALIVIGGPAGRWLRPLDRMLGALVLSRFGKQRFLPFLSHTSLEDLLVLRDLVESGEVTPVIDRSYPLAETADAVRYVETMRARGKVVITV